MTPVRAQLQRERLFDLSISEGAWRLLIANILDEILQSIGDQAPLDETTRPSISVSQRFDTGTDDLASLGTDVDATYDCNTCGARVALVNLDRHHRWHFNHNE